jgi:hypothetical protein
MRSATLISWLVTASLGVFMLRTWLVRGGLRRERAKAGGLPPQLIFGHAAAAIIGLLTWAAFLASGVRPLAWTAIALLMVAVCLGLCTVTLWTPYPARRPGMPAVDAGAGVPAVDAGTEPDNPLKFEVTDEMIARLLADPVSAPQPRPIRPNPAVVVPIAHGFAAIATFVLAVTSAIM